MTDHFDHELVHGTCDPQFTAVAESFVQNFEARNEVGASVCVRVAGEIKVDLWGGMASARRKVPWDKDTVTVVYSCTKAATALCAHILVARGQLDVQARVTDYWPEFGQNGKENATVAMILNHTVGLPALREPLRNGGCKDFDYMTAQLAAAAPEWEPGTRTSYHMLNFGWTVGELVRRISGKSLGTFFREEVAEPLGIDFTLGTPASTQDRFAKSIPFVPVGGETITSFIKALGDAESISHKSLFNNGGFQPNDPAVLAAEIGGGGGVSNARGLAGMFTPLALDGSYDGVRLVDADTHAAMGRISSATELDGTLLVPTRFGPGFMKSMDNRRRPTGGTDSVILGEHAFGHVGAGGSIGFADPECELSFGYAMNRMGMSILLNERGQSLVDTTYQCLGYQSDKSGCWRR